MNSEMPPERQIPPLCPPNRYGTESADFERPLVMSVNEPWRACRARRAAHGWRPFALALVLEMLSPPAIAAQPVFRPGEWLIAVGVNPHRPLTGQYCFRGRGFLFTSPRYARRPRGAQCTAGPLLSQGDTLIATRRCDTPQASVELLSTVTYDADRLWGNLVARFKRPGAKRWAWTTTITVAGQRLGSCPSR